MSEAEAGDAGFTLAETTHLVPVTGRSLDALRRVNVPFAAGVCAHGGVVLGEEHREHRPTLWHGGRGSGKEPPCMATAYCSSMARLW